MTKSKILSLGALLAAATLSFAQAPKKKPAPSTPAPAAASPAVKLEGLDDLAAQAMKEWKVPGVALAVVEDGKVIYAKGYGYRDLESKLPVTTATLFPIGSITKSFTALTFGILKNEGKVDWDQPVRTYLPEFQMNDPVASEQATPRDLFSHRTGLPRHDLVWYSSDFSREDLVSRLRYLKPNKGFRGAYQYNNLTVMTMGYLEGKLSGLGWEGAIREKIFAPLGMSHSNLSVTDIEKTDDHALPYGLKKDVVTRIPFHNIDAIGPAGSINSSVDDMSHYLIFQLGDGKCDGKPIVAESDLREMHSPQTAIPDPPPAFSMSGLGHFSYGLAWVVTAYRGHNLVWHNGGIDGFYALLSMLPDDHLGVVVLTNLPEGQTPEVLAYNVYDRLLGLDPLPWFDRFKDLEAKGKKQEEEAKKNKPTDRKTGTHPSHRLADYAGEYQNPGYGIVKVALKGDALELSLNKLGPFPLEHYHYDLFQVPEDSDSVAAGEKFQFEMNKKGDIDGIAAALEPALSEDIIFTRAPEKISTDVLQKLAGDYLLGPQTVTFAVTGGVLRLAVPGQPVYELIPRKELSFEVKSLPGFSVDFQMDASGKVAEAVFNQPNGVFHAKRK
ncbi:MAG TPA: serine hydrolase [Candidatus Acidoferrum sp.]|jgi:CubicO group peptidase (beta-lactamase class C family)|nr:serine hydrolase [Candidatus Acidoferrum sp.]